MNVEPVALESIFLNALEKPPSEERAAYLDATCANDLVLRRRVEALLCAHEDAGNFLEEPLELIGSASRTRIQQGTDAPTVHAVNDVALEILDLPRRRGFLAALGPYDITGLVGRGGMGVVLKGHDPQLNRTVAIKVMAPGLAVDPQARRWFLREARAAAAVRHERVVTIYSTDEVRGFPYLVMEHVSGGSLQQRLDRTGPMRAEEVIRIGREVAEGLSAAHAQGLVHRDVKPANVLLEEGSEQVKITDFGLARAVDERGVSESSVLAGTPQYLAPEQAEGRPVDHRCDQFGLGCLLYALCTGHPPFSGRTTIAVLRAVCEDAPQPIAELNPHVPNELVRIIDRLLEKNPARRFGSAAEVAELLGRSPEELRQWSLRRSPASRSRRSRVAALALLALLVVPLWLMGPKQAREDGSDRAAEVIRDRDARPMGKPPAPLPASPLFGEIRKNFIGGRLNALVVAPDGRTAYVSGSETIITAWDLKTGTSRQTFVGHKSSIRCLAISSDGTRLASCSGDRTLRIWCTQSGSELLTLRFQAPAFCIAFSPAGRSILASFFPSRGAVPAQWKRNALNVDSNSVMAFDTTTGNLNAVCSAGKQHRYCAVALSADGGQIAAGTHDGSIILFDARTNRTIWEQKASRDPSPRRIGHRGPIHALRFSRDGTRLYSSGNSNRLICWNLADYKLTWQRVFMSGFTRFDLSADETWAVVNGDRGVRLLDLTGRVSDRGFFSLPGHTHLVRGVAFLPRSEQVVSCGWDGTLRLWKLPPRPGPAG